MGFVFCGCAVDQKSLIFLEVSFFLTRSLMDSFPFEDNFGASMDNSIDLDDKDLDDAINGNFLPFVDLEEAINNLDNAIDGNFLPFKDLEEAINNDFFLFFGASMTIIFVLLSSTRESWTPATFDCDTMMILHRQTILREIQLQPFVRHRHLL